MFSVRALLPVVAFFCSLLAIVWQWIEGDFSSRYSIFLLWFLPVVSFIGVSLFPRSGSILVLDPEGVSLTERRWLTVLLVAFVVPYFLFLSSYPFISIHDELRDGGLRAFEIHSGRLLNIFGRDWSQGLVFATLCSFVYTVFGPSVLTYRIPSALCGALHVAIVFGVLARVVGARFAFFSSVLLATTAGHLYFARTEGLIIISMLCGSVAFLFLVRALYEKGSDILPIACGLGATVGFSVGMHASVRAVALICGASFILTLLVFARSGVLRWRYSAAALGLFLLFVPIGGGPQLVYLLPRELLHSGQMQSSLGIAEIASRYWESLLSLTGASLQVHFHSGKLVTPWVSALLGVSLLFVILFGRTVSLLSVAFTGVIFFTNSALTEQLNAGHRVMIVAPFLAFICAEPLSRLYTWLQSRSAIAAVSMITAFVALGGYEVQKFFLQGTAIQHYEPYLSRPFGFSFRHLVEYIQSAPDWRGKSNLFIFVKEETRLSEELKTGHVVEAFDYLFPTFRVTVVPSELVGHYSLYISPTAQLPAHFQWEEVQLCSDTSSLGPSTKFQRFFACNEPFFPIYQMKAME